jgi:hypothetical protein
MILVWSDASVSECPGCGATVAVGIMSLAATCACGMYYVDIHEGRGWYFSQRHYARGEKPLNYERGDAPLQVVT